MSSAGGDGEVAVEGEDVLVDGRGGDVEGGGGLISGVAVEEELEDLASSRGEGVELGLDAGSELGPDASADLIVDDVHGPPVAAGEGWGVEGRWTQRECWTETPGCWRMEMT
ncbi:MAG: hypothetical protein R3B49_03130 [Phycisphaerales bacterium]